MPCPIQGCTVTTGTDNPVKTFIPTLPGALQNQFTLVSPTGDAFQNVAVTLETVKQQLIAESTGLGLTPTWITFVIVDEQVIGSNRVANVQISVDEDAMEIAFPLTEFLNIQISASNGSQTTIKSFCYTPSTATDIFIVILANESNDRFWTFDPGDPENTTNEIIQLGDATITGRPAYSSATAKIYWTDEKPSPGTMSLQEINVDGTSQAEVVSIASGSSSEDSNCAVNGVFIGYHTTQRKASVNVDGTDQQTWSTISSGFIDIAPALDTREFWYASLSGSDIIERRVYDTAGTIKETVNTGVTNPSDLASDPANGNVFWINNGTDIINKIVLGGGSTAVFKDESGARLFLGLIGVLDGKLWVFHDDGNGGSDVWVGSYDLVTAVFTAADNKRIDNITDFSGKQLFPGSSAIFRA